MTSRFPAARPSTGTIAPPPARARGTRHPSRAGAGLGALALCLGLAASQAGAGPANEPPAGAAVEPAVLEGPDYYDAQRFPGAGDSVFHPDADLPAPVRAVLLLDAHEADVRHARYRVRADLVSPADADGAPVAWVEVVRFNLGPAVRSALAAQDPTLPLAPVEAFGTAPHVVYRFRMAPVQGMQAGLRAAERWTLDGQAAGDMDCLGQPCLSATGIYADEGAWHAIDAVMPSLPFRAGDAAGTVPAAVLAFLHQALGEDARMPVPRADRARLEFVLDHDVEGQDSFRAGVARNAVVLDDQVSSRWVRWRGIGADFAEAGAREEPR